jgi:hypothetical protein
VDGKEREVEEWQQRVRDDVAMGKIVIVDRNCITRTVAV